MLVFGIIWCFLGNGPVKLFNLSAVLRYKTLVNGMLYILLSIEQCILILLWNSVILIEIIKFRDMIPFCFLWPIIVENYAYKEIGIMMILTYTLFFQKNKKIKEARNQTSPTYLIHGWTLNYKSIKKISTSIWYHFLPFLCDDVFIKFNWLYF